MNIIHLWQSFSWVTYSSGGLLLYSVHSASSAMYSQVAQLLGTSLGSDILSLTLFIFSACLYVIIAPPVYRQCPTSYQSPGGTSHLSGTRLPMAPWPAAPCSPPLGPGQALRHPPPFCGAWMGPTGCDLRSPPWSWPPSDRPTRHTPA